MNGSIEVEVVNQRGLHARAAAKLVRMASKFDAETTVIKDGTRIPATSILGLMTLGAQKGSKLAIESVGHQAENALLAIAGLFASGFGEAD